MGHKYSEINHSYALLGMGPPRPAWVQLIPPSPALTSFSECSVLDKTASHLILECSLQSAPRGYNGLLVLDYETRCWPTTPPPTFEVDFQ